MFTLCSVRVLQPPTNPCMCTHSSQLSMYLCKDNFFAEDEPTLKEAEEKKRNTYFVHVLFLL